MEMCLFRTIIFPVLLKKPEMWIDHGIVIKRNINMIFKTAKVCKIINYFHTKFRYISSFVFLYFKIIRHHTCISKKCDVAKNLFRHLLWQSNFKNILHKIKCESFYGKENSIPQTFWILNACVAVNNTINIP